MGDMMTSPPAWVQETSRGGTTPRRVIEGCRLPDDRSLTPSGRAWVEVLRVIAGDADPPVTLGAVQLLRRVLVER